MPCFSGYLSEEVERSDCASARAWRLRYFGTDWRGHRKATRQAALDKHSTAKGQGLL